MIDTSKKYMTEGGDRVVGLERVEDPIWVYEGIIIRKSGRRQPAQWTIGGLFRCDGVTHRDTIDWASAE